jgi:hypothetical protein
VVHGGRRRGLEDLRRDGAGIPMGLVLAVTVAIGEIFFLGKLLVLLELLW